MRVLRAVRLFFYTLNYLMKGGENMVAVYVALIIYKRRTINTVPARFQGSCNG